MNEKNRRQWIVILAAIVLLAAALLFVRFARRSFRPPMEERSRFNGEAQVTEVETVSYLGNLLKSERSYDMKNGTVVFGRMCARKGESRYHMIREDILPTASGTVWYYDAESAGWKTSPLDTMQLNSTCVYIEGEGADFFYYLPMGYCPLENNSLRLTGSMGFLSIKKGIEGWRVQMFGSYLDAGELCDYTLVKGEGEPSLLDTDKENVMKLWATYCNAGDGRWCYDGYYFPAAYNYIPTGTNVLYRCVAAYGANSMEGQSKGTRCANLLSAAMLDTLSLQQNEAGYFPSMSGSEWLKADYGIDPGYYDTRFNSDLLLIFSKHIRRTGALTEPASRYMDFFLRHAEECHYETANGGWLVWDYAPASKPVHCSLNHQLAEMLDLYEYAELLQRPELTELADRMLLGIEDTKDGWIRDDSNLHYCQMPDGTFGKEDYPYLTYNDLYNIQKKYEELGRDRSPELDELMAAKLTWMQANGVTGYKE